MTLEEVKKDLVHKGEALLMKRSERLLNRKVILLPWLRIKWLLKKIQILRGLAIHKCACHCSNPH